MVNGYLLAGRGREIFAGCKVNNGRFCPPRGRSGKAQVSVATILSSLARLLQFPSPPRLGRGRGMRAEVPGDGAVQALRGSVPMENALLVGLSRQMVLGRELDIVANNIANIETTGYKSDNAAFTQYLMPGARDNEFAGNDRRISFVQDRASWIDLSPGAVQHTGNPLDVAIDGKGYLVVQTPRGQRYTRNGALSINSAGQLVTSDGDQVLGTGGPITFQPTDRDIVISPTGIVSVRDGSGTISAQRAQLQVVNFDQPQ